MITFYRTTAEQLYTKTGLNKNITVELVSKPAQDDASDDVTFQDMS